MTFSQEGVRAQAVMRPIIWWSKEDTIMDEVYEQLAQALDRLPNGFPRTPSNVEIPLLKKIFSPEEAFIANQLGMDMESLSVTSKRLELSQEEARSKLTAMAGRSLLWSDEEEGEPRFRLAPFIIGIYEPSSMRCARAK